MIGVVLAGGAGKRMGQDKAEVVVADRPMISWVIGALESVVDRVIISGGPAPGTGTRASRIEREWQGR